MALTRPPHSGSAASSSISGSEGALFGALVRSTSVDVNDVLGLPALPLDHTHISLLPRKVRMHICKCTQCSSRHRCSTHLHLGSQGFSPLPSTPTPPTSPPPPSSTALMEERLSLLKEAAAVSSTELAMQRGWEGWFSDLSFLCDTSPPVPHHLACDLASKHACLAGLSSDVGLLEVEEPSPFCGRLLQQVDAVPYTTIHPTAQADHVLFSVSRCLQSLLVSCRTKMMVLAGQSVPLVGS